MSLGSTVAKNNDLAANYGDDHSSVMPSAFNARLYVGDPSDPEAPGVEFSGNGYSPPVLSNATAWFGVPDNGQLGSPADIVFGTSTDAWIADGSSIPTHLALTDATTGDLYDVLQIPDNPGVNEAGQTVRIAAGNLIIEVD